MNRFSGGLVLLAALACGGDGRTTVVRITSWQTPEETALDLPAIRAFEEAHPGVRVENEPVSNQAEYREKVITSIVSGAPPDLFLLDGIDVPAFVASGVMLDLRPFAARVGMDLDDFYPSVLSMFSRGDAVYAFPKGFSPVVYYYNKALFDAAGVPYPRDDWTFAEFVATARALTKDLDGDGTTDQWGTALIRFFYAWQGIVWSGGGDVLTKDGTRATGALDRPETLAAMEFLTSLSTVHKVAPPPNAFRAVSGTESRLFYSGKLALLPSGHWLIPNIRAELANGRLRLGVVSLPRAPNATVQTPLFASAWAVPRNTRHRRLAVELAAALTGREAQGQRVAAGLELSAMADVQRRFAAEDTVGLDAAFLRQVANGRPPWGATIAAYREVEAQLPEIIDRVVIQKETVAQAVRAVARRIDGVLAR